MAWHGLAVLAHRQPVLLNAMFADMGTLLAESLPLIAW